MKRFAVATALIGAAVAIGQDSTSTGVQPDNRGRYSASAGQARSGDLAAMYEDIEIMRRLLAGKLARSDGGTQYGYYLAPQGQPSQSGFLRFYEASSATGFTGNLTSTTAPGRGSVNWAGGTAGSSAIDGIYLDGKGVVFTLTLPQGIDFTKETATPPHTPSVSQWDIVRKEVRGEKIEPAAAQAHKPQSPVDVILHTLAENGKNIRLRDGEDVVVAVTFRGQPLKTVQGMNLFPASPPPDVKSAGSPASSVPIPEANAPHGQTFRDYELLGNLHLRQKQYAQAVEAYKKALEKNDPDASSRGGVLQRMAEARLQMGDIEEARNVLSLALQNIGKDKKDDSAKSDTFAKPAPLPARLIITASKKALADVGSGKLSFDEFRKATRIDYVEFGDKS